MKKILIADDDPQVRRVLSRIFSSQWEVIEAEDGEKAMSEIRRKYPDLVILDINMPKIGGKEILEMIRKDLRTMTIPVIVITGYDSMLGKISGLEMGADDYINKPFNINEVLWKANNLIQRQLMAMASNPLTGLPGTPLIEKAALERIRENKTFAFMYIDIDNFKAYNDSYGYIEGDKAIKQTARIIKDLYEKYQHDYFFGHIGGDDFVIICSVNDCEKIADEIAFEFDKQVRELYRDEDLEKGFIESADREGNIKRFPLMRLSIAIVTNEKRNISHYAKIIDIAFEIKKFLKSFKDRKGSLFLKDRRKD